ncbi:hypothetical protein GCM10010320_27080 [Streptomyces caelestis]|nr:hypothetical protein GCM10010320_27080 [Streptomyces caelestis]
MDLLEHRYLDLQVAAFQQALAQRLDGGGAGADHLAGVGARDQVEVAAADLGLRVGQAAVPDPNLVGQGGERVGGLGPVPSGEAERRQ